MQAQALVSSGCSFVCRVPVRGTPNCGQQHCVAVAQSGSNSESTDLGEAMLQEFVSEIREEKVAEDEALAAEREATRLVREASGLPELINGWTPDEYPQGIDPNQFSNFGEYVYALIEAEGGVIRTPPEETEEDSVE